MARLFTADDALEAVLTAPMPPSGFDRHELRVWLYDANDLASVKAGQKTASSLRPPLAHVEAMGHRVDEDCPPPIPAPVTLDPFELTLTETLTTTIRCVPRPDNKGFTCAKKP